MEIKDKVIVITGASEGIGRAAALHLAQKDGKIVMTARSEDKLKVLEKEIPESLAVTADMRKPEDIKHLVRKALQKYGRIDILINNAGQGMYGPVEHINIEDFKKIMELNVFSVVRAMQEVIPIMRKQKAGMIVNISSGVSKRYIPGIGAYSATKYALNAITFIARQELEKDNIKVCSLAPKITKSGFSENAINPRPVWDSSRGPAPPIDTAEQVAEKIAEIIETEKEEIIL